MNNISLRISVVVKSLVLNMSSSTCVYDSYESAVQKLNTLQSNKSTLEQIRKDLKTGQKCTNIEDMQNYLQRTGVTLNRLDKLSVIHVAGTKGKGSTSAMCESILRHHGYRTGFFSSPHLVAVRERIRLDGRVVSKDKFAKHFHDVYDMLNGSKAHDADMPKYFAFLTVLAYNMFLKEKVDVAIVEVGIGGIVDYTNVLRKVPVVGITALGLDHTSILGTTLPEIAAAKAGVMKRGCEAFTVQQPPDAMHVLRRYAAHVQCTLTVVPDYKEYAFPKSYKPIDLEAYQSNASLAIQLAHAWMRIAHLNTISRQSLKKVAGGKTIRQNGFTEFDTPYNNDKYINNIIYSDTINSVPNETVLGLQECRWPGRYQIIRSEYANFYLDGAHTKESMEICAQWFEKNNSCEDKILLFSATGDRDAEVLLNPLCDMNFRKVYFVIPKAYKEINQKNDNYSVTEHQELIDRCKKNAKAWKNIRNCKYSNNEMEVLESVSEALISIKRRQTKIVNTSVLITGSLHLVGAALSILDPNLSRD